MIHWIRVELFESCRNRIVSNLRTDAAQLLQWNTIFPIMNAIWIQYSTDVNEIAESYQNLNKYVNRATFYASRTRQEMKNGSRIKPSTWISSFCTVCAVHKEIRLMKAICDMHISDARILYVLIKSTSTCRRALFVHASAAKYAHSPLMPSSGSVYARAIVNASEYTFNRDSSALCV